MTAKKRRTFTIDDDLHRELGDREELNASAVVNKLLREYMAAGKAPEAALEMRLNEIDTEIQSKRQKAARIETRIEQLERQRSEIEDQIRERRRNTTRGVLDLVELIEAGRFDPSNLTVKNEAVKTRAEKTGMTPTRYVEAVKAELGGEP